MTDIQVARRTVTDLFTSKPYSIGYYQREYRWGKEHVAQLLNDLFGKFQKSWQPEHEREAIWEYEVYFLGLMILTNGPFADDIIDGQQRLTTLSLLLMALRRRSDVIDERQQDDLARLVASSYKDEHDFKRNLKLAVDERRSCMWAIFSGNEKSVNSSEPSVRNMIDRFRDIEEFVENALDPHAFPCFVDWLLQRVQMVSVVAPTEADAYTVFETMNDRGLRLSMPEMLRGYLLSQIDHEETRLDADTAWKQGIGQLTVFGQEEDTDAIQAWLRGRYAITASQYRAGVIPGDFERIGNEFHRWVRDNEIKRLKLHQPSDFAGLILDDFKFYARWYARLRGAGDQEDDGLESVLFVTSQGFTLHYMLLLSAISTKDTNDMAMRKLRAVSAFVDILIHRRLWNSMRITQTALRYRLFDFAKELRTTASLDDVVATLTRFTEEDPLGFSPDVQFRKNRRNGKVVRRVLARLTLHVDEGSARHLRYTNLLETGLNGYDIEHVIADDHEQHYTDWVEKPAFDEERNWIGGLLLLPSRMNRSIGKLEYKEKVGSYQGKNSLAASLGDPEYKQNPAFQSFLAKSGLPFRPYEHFGRDELYERQRLYEQIAEQVWSPERIWREAGL